MEAQKPRSNDALSFEDLFTQADDKLKHGLTTLSQWSNELQNIIEGRPAVVLTSLAITGFMFGLVARQGRRTQDEKQSASSSARTSGLRLWSSADTWSTVLASMAAGYFIGPRVLNSIANEADKRGAPNLRSSA